MRSHGYSDAQTYSHAERTAYAAAASIAGSEIVKAGARETLRELPVPVESLRDTAQSASAGNVNELSGKC